MNEISRVLSAIRNGDPRAPENLLPLVYDELRKLAAAKMAREIPGQTLQATALVHEAYSRLVEGDSVPDWDNRGHFFAAAAEAMRRILVESVRRKKRQKRGGEMRRTDLSDVAAPEIREDLIALDVALDRLKLVDAQAAEFVQLRYFGGLTIAESAELLGISPRSADRVWAFARAWLHREVTGAECELKEK